MEIPRDEARQCRGKQWGQVVGTCASAARSVPEAFLWLPVIMLSVVWATRREILPGWAFIGAVIPGILWACLYTGLGLAYRAVALKEGASARNVVRKLGLGLLVALISTYICKLLLEPLLAPAPWAAFCYLGGLLPPVFIGLWCTALMPRDTRRLYRAAKTNAAMTPLSELIVLPASAAVLVSCADLVFQGSGGEAHLKGDRYNIILTSAWATNTLLLFSAYALIFAVTRRVTTGLLVVSPFYAALGLATLAKIKYMHSAVQPLDLLRVPEFLPLFQSFFGTGVLVATVAALGIWLGALVAVHRTAPCRMSSVRRRSLGLLSLAVLLVFPAAFSVAHSLPTVDALLLLCGAPEDQHREKARRNGFLLSFLSELPAMFVSTPSNYSPMAVASTFRKYWHPGMITPKDSRGAVNLIIYLVESLMDPEDLGLHYTRCLFHKFITS